MKRIGLLALVLAVASGATAAVALAAAASPKAFRASVVRTALAQKSLRWVEHDYAGNVAVSSSADVNAHSGTQYLTVTIGKQSGTIHIVFINGIAYVEGQALGLAVNLGLTNAQATQYAGRWISVTKGDKAYAATADGLTLASIVHDVTPHGPLELVKKEFHGKQVFALEALGGPQQAPVFRVLVAPRKGQRLPIEASSINPSRALSTHTDFSRWNEPVNVHAPSGSIPIATVRS